MSNIIKANKPFSTDDLSVMLQERKDHTSLVSNVTRLVPTNVKKQQSVKGATLYDLIGMISEIVTKASKERNIIFEPDEGVRVRNDQTYSIDESHIFYSVISRKPCLELKPRERQEVDEVDAAGKVRQGRIWGQRFECVLQFDIIAGNYVVANQTLDFFEDLMFNYTFYFKKNGVVEILFDEQLTDSNFNIYRQDLSVRSLRYRVWIEKLYAAFDAGEIDGIISGR